ncbi:beta-galactosidase [Streptosporangium album]|uniref:Beta-galactosidase n=2 Tax=Streptosporangium album TaxID=47479 RepID=A0A7W7RZD3_9ACTN|nr:beta-galactosidase [Streptosporangium album]
MNRMDRLYRRLGGIAYGGDYNPEQWPEEVHAEDVRLMREAGVNLVSLGIFSWAFVQPEPDRMEFGRFDRIMDRLADGGVGVCLATMTASPPPWLSARHPEVLPERADGTRLWPGARQHYCPSSPVYREHAARLVSAVAERYGDHPALAMWHIGNEYGCHVRACYCDVSAGSFREWLRERYGDVEALNDAWSTAFWSQRYASFEEVLPPRTAPTFPNPAQQIDFARFGSDELLACYLTEKRILDRIAPEVPATTNFVPLAKTLDLFEWASHLDVVSYDSYPDPHDEHAAPRAALSYDVMRSLRGGQPYLLMEQAPSAVNWRARNAPKPPGVMRLWSWQAVAHGADAVMFFQWRQSRGGAEKYHSAMVPHGGTDTRAFREVRELGQELASVPELFGARSPRADVAVVLDWQSWWGLEQAARPNADLRLDDLVFAHYLPLYQENVACDIVRPGGDLSGYRLVVVPNLYMAGEEEAANLERYVEGGGTLLMSFFSGIVDPCDRVHLGGYPAPFRRMLGLRVEEFWPLDDGVGVELSRGRGSLWSEEITLEGAEAVASFSGGELTGLPAVTRHRFGLGAAWYLGTLPDPATMRELLRRAGEEAGVRPVLPGLPAGVQARVRQAADGTLRYVLLNHSAEAVTVPLPAPMCDDLAGAGPSDHVRLASRGAALLRPAATPV